MHCVFGAVLKCVFFRNSINSSNELRKSKKNNWYKTIDRVENFNALFPLH